MQKFRLLNKWNILCWIFAFQLVDTNFWKSNQPSRLVGFHLLLAATRQGIPPILETAPWFYQKSHPRKTRWLWAVQLENPEADSLPWHAAQGKGRGPEHHFRGHSRRGGHFHVRRSRHDRLRSHLGLSSHWHISRGSREAARRNRPRFRLVKSSAQERGPRRAEVSRMCNQGNSEAISSCSFRQPQGNRRPDHFRFGGAKRLDRYHLYLRIASRRKILPRARQVHPGALLVRKHRKLASVRLHAVLSWKTKLYWTKIRHDGGKDHLGERAASFRARVAQGRKGNRAKSRLGSETTAWGFDQVEAKIEH